MKRRILSSLMALVLVFGLLPATAFAEGEAASTAKTIYVDAIKGDDTQAEVGTAADKAYQSIGEAVKAAKSGDTIKLAEGNYSLYDVCGKNGASNSEEYTKNKDLTFVGQEEEVDKVNWYIGANPTPEGYKGEYDGDYCFDGAKTITFRNLTLRAGSKDYLGFIRADKTIVEDCIINGKTFYWGYTSATFKNTTFNCPTVKKYNIFTVGEYAIWTYCSPVMTFDNCTFNSYGKVINVYNENSEADYTINFNNCTVNSIWSPTKQVLNIDDHIVKGFTINITGDTVLNGYDTEDIVDNKTCSRLFGFGGKAGNNAGKTTVNFGNTTVWQDGKMVDAEAYHNDGVKVDGVSYNNGVAGAKDILYAEGYKDNQVTVDEGKWTEDSNGIWSHKVTKKCGYCSYKKETTEYAPIVWNVPKSKTATQLDTNTWTSDVTLSLLNTKETLATGKDHIGAGSTVTDTIGKKFDFVGIKSLTVGGTELKSKAVGNVTYFGNDASTLNDSCYRFKVDYDSAKDAFVWTINEEVTQSAPVQLTYTVKLAAPETEPGTYGTKDLKGDDLTLTDAEALFTNESAVLNAKNSVGVPVEEQVFPKPSVSYTISSGTGGDDGDDDDKYYFAIQKVDAQDGHALNGAKFGLYLDGKQVATATSNRSGIAMFRVNESDYRKINAKSDLYYQELTAPEGYVVNSDEVSIEKSNLTTSWSKAEKDAETVRNYRGVTPDLLNDSDHFAYVIGYMDGNVRPYGLISRAETTTIFFRLLKDSVRDGNLLTSNTYTDVADDYWANTAISTMTGLGIVQGRSADTFDPKAPITRAQFAAICARFDTGKSSGEQTFSDIQGHWAEKYIERAAELGWIKGFEDGTFRPDTYITRAQAMTMINRVLNRIPEEESDLLPGMNVWPDCNPGDWFYLAVQEATNSHDFEHKAGNYETWTGMNKDPDWTRYEH